MILYISLIRYHVPLNYIQQVGLVIHSVQYLMFGFLESSVSLYVMMGVTSIASIADPSMRAALSEQVTEEEQGLRLRRCFLRFARFSGCM